MSEMCWPREGGPGRPSASPPGGPDAPRPRRAPDLGPDRGAGSVLGLALVAVLLVLTLAVVGLSRAVHARGTAQAAADLGALAAAKALHDLAGPGDPCAVAAEVVAANGADVVRCREVGGDVVVSTRVPLADGTGLAARAVARAGPAD